MNCVYYQGYLDREKIWFVVGMLRNEDHLCFERTVDKNTNLFEFFVPAGNEQAFLYLMDYCVAQGYVFDLQKKPQRS
ncbi:hypothetical protein FJ365_00160 [Candidatus Dependentiae bacterium]|nr:hypothetical protein [Candidatus Dependentiae bacterium]